MGAILHIKNFGPIKEAEIGVKDFLVLAGPQSSGKSTISKLIYYFMSIQKLILDTQISTYNPAGVSLLSKVFIRLYERFLSMFEVSAGGTESEIYFEYTNGEFVKILFPFSVNMEIEYSKRIYDYLNDSITSGIMPDQAIKQKWNSSLNAIFGQETVMYIPAGRNITATMGRYLAYWFATMNDDQKAQIDYFSRKYIEEVIRLEPLFDMGLSGLAAKYDDKLSPERKKYGTAFRVLTEELLNGEYRYKNGVEKLLLDNGEDIDIKYASSGQQEAVWISNILMYYILTQEKTLFIIEEPEAHLFPDGQTLITRLISIAHNAGNSVIFTTHSPYILGEVNNLFYANYLHNKGIIDFDDEVIAKYGLLEQNLLDINKSIAYFVKDGTAELCIDEDTLMIDQDRIDGASNEINGLFDEMVELERKHGKD